MTEKRDSVIVSQEVNPSKKMNPLKKVALIDFWTTMSTICGVGEMLGKAKERGDKIEQRGDVISIIGKNGKELPVITAQQTQNLLSNLRATSELLSIMNAVDKQQGIRGRLGVKNELGIRPKYFNNGNGL